MTETIADDSDAFERLHERWKRIAYLEDARLLLNWDQQVTMPPGGGPARSKQFGALSATKHELKTGDETAELLGRLDDATLSPDREAVIREIRREHDRETAVPQGLVERLSNVQSDAFADWKAAKEADDYDRFAPTLADHVDGQVRRAEHVDPDRDPYPVLFEDGAPYLGIERVESIFDDLLDALPPLIEDVRESEADLAIDALAGDFDPDEQMALAEDALDLLGYDWSRGRIDTADHPFDGLTQFDARITTRFEDDSLVPGLTSAIHEFGHATYNLGLPDDAYGSPLGRARGHGVHESQSRFWENHVGRSRAFWERFLPVAKERFPELNDASPADAYEAVNQVFDANPIRTRADELTYHMHILVRHEVERELLDGDLSVEEVPSRWNAKHEQYLGIVPENDAVGCLQDVHWTTAFGMFPNYTIGSVLAAQLAAAMERDLGSIDDVIREDGFGPIHEWLTQRVHRHGRRYTTDDLIERATGEPLTAEYFVEYVEEKYRDLYDC